MQSSLMTVEITHPAAQVGLSVIISYLIIVEQSISSVREAAGSFFLPCHTVEEPGELLEKFGWPYSAI